MMNKQKSSKAGLWKVATFLPLLALLLMAFGKAGENVPMESSKMGSLYQQNPKVKETATQPKEKVSTNADVLPQFPGEDKALNKFLSEKLQYPKEAKEKGIQGKVFISFVVNSEGKIIDPHVTRSVDPALDAEALRLVGLMPNWIPGKQKGVSVSVSYALPINFCLK